MRKIASDPMWADWAAEADAWKAYKLFACVGQLLPHAILLTRGAPCGHSAPGSALPLRQMSAHRAHSTIITPWRSERQFELSRHACNFEA